MAGEEVAEVIGDLHQARAVVPKQTLALRKRHTHKAFVVSFF